MASTSTKSPQKDQATRLEDRLRAAVLASAERQLKAAKRS